MKKLVTYKLFENENNNNAINRSLYTMYSNTLDDVKYLVEERGADVNYIHTYGETPLIQAVSYSKADIVEYLISKGAVVNFQSNIGWTALMSVSNEECLDILLKNGADVNLTNDDGLNLLIVITKYDVYVTISCFDKILKTDIDLTHEDNNGHTFIDYMSGNYKRWILMYDIQEIIFRKSPELYSKFKEYNIQIHPDIKKEFPALSSADELNLL